jgi:1,2-diacylglycerol 3-alpha-glucosyltransferase
MVTSLPAKSLNREGYNKSGTEEQKMRIGMMADVYKPHVSGVTNYIALNKRVLTQMGHEVYVFTFGDEEYQDDESNVIRSPGLPLLDTGYYVSFRYSLLAKRTLRSMDLVHVHHPFLTGSLALRYCRPRGIPIIFTNHTRYDLYAKAYLPVLPDIIGESALEAYLPAFCRACDLVISPSNGMKEVLQNLGVNTPIEIIPNGVDFDPVRQKVEPFNRNDFGITPEDIVLIYTGRLSPEKNLPFLLRCFSGLAQAYENTHMILVGDGPERENLENLVQITNQIHRIHFTGMVDYAKVYSYLAGSDAFVTASITEVHPFSVIEAMAMGLPVLGIASPGISDTVEDGYTGFMVQAVDFPAYTAKMVRLVSENEQRKIMGENARRVADNYSIDQTAKQMVSLYQKVINTRKQIKPGIRVMWTRLLDRWRG